MLKQKILAPLLCTAIALVMTCRCDSARAEVMHFTIDPQSSQITATVPEALERTMGDVDGTFQIMSGDVAGDATDVARTGHVHLEIDPTTYHSDSRHRDWNVLKDSLQTAIYGAIIFDSTRLEDLEIGAPGAVGTATVVGNLTLHGTTREIKVPVSVSLSPEGILSAQGETTFDYTAFGVRPPRLLFMLPAGSNVTIKYSIKATRATPAAAPSPTPNP